MPFWECETHVVNATSDTIKVCVYDNENRPTDFTIKPGDFKKCKTKKGRVTVSAFRVSEGETEKVHATYSGHTSVIVRTQENNKIIEIVASKMGDIWIPTHDGTEQRTYLDSAIETFIAIDPLSKWIFVLINLYGLIVLIRYIPKLQEVYNSIIDFSKY